MTLEAASPPATATFRSTQTASSEIAASSGAAPGSSMWLISAPVDLAAFLGSAVASLALLWVGYALGLLHQDTPDWTWVSVVLLIDVAHVYATGFRVYFDRAEFARRRWLYVLTPVLSFILGVALYSQGEQLFWRALAYLAVFHFVRQQYGWVALYNSRRGDNRKVGMWIDTAAIYAATVYPLIYWHAHLPRKFWWFVERDFSTLPLAVANAAAPIYWCCLGAYAARSLYLAVVERRFNPGKDIVVFTTALCWYVGIIASNSDYAFTVTNVINHGVPYLVFVYWYWTSGKPATKSRLGRWRAVAVFLGTVWFLAFVEELFWDRGVWHDHRWLFGAGWEIGGWTTLLVPMLAVPQISHYLLDGFIWRRRSNPRLSRAMTGDPAAAVGSTRHST